MMSSKRFLVAVLMMAVAATALTGCKNPPWKRKPAAGPVPETAVPPLGSGGDIAAAERGDFSTAQRGQFAPVLFDFDSARIKPSEYPKLEAVAAALRGNNKRLLIEGHCDERGTAEYNRALGERRALAAREELIKLGIAPHRISTVSYGSERPVDPGHDEAAWARNRRCEFLITGQ